MQMVISQSGGTLGQKAFHRHSHTNTERELNMWRFNQNQVNGQLAPLATPGETTQCKL